MDAPRTNAPFATSNGKNLLTKELLSSESHIIEEILKINELMKKCTCLNDKELHNSTRNSSSNQNDDSSQNPTDQNDCKKQRLKDGDQEIHFQVTSKSYSCLERKTVSSSTILLKINSSTTLKKTESGNSKLSGTETSAERIAKCSDNSVKKKNQASHENVEIDNKLRNLALQKEKSCTLSSFKNEDNKIHPKQIQNLEDETIGDAAFGCPFELVEIYCSKKGKGDEYNCRKRFVGTIEETNSKRIHSNEDNISDNFECTQEDRKCDGNISQVNVLENNFGKPTQDGANGIIRSKLHEDVNNEFLIVKSEKDEGNKSLNFVTAFKETDKKCVEEKLNVMDGKGDTELIEEHRNLQKCNEEGTENPPVYKTNVLIPQKSYIRSNNSNTSENMNFSKRGTRTHDVSINKEDKPLVQKEGIEELLPTIEETDHKEKCDSDSLNSDLHKSEIHTENVRGQSTDSSSSEGKVSKTSLKSDASDVLKDSKSDSSSIENTIGYLKGTESNFTRQNSDAKSVKGNNIKIIIEKRENRKNCTSKQCHENARQSRINHKRERQQDSRKIVTKSEIEDPKHGISVHDSKKDNVNYDDLSICKTLTNIYERLAHDWQRMERLRTKLQNTASMESDNSVKILQLLDKAIARCKSYIHGASDSSEAESKITKLLSKYIIELVRIVNENKITLENQDRRVHEMHLDSLQGQHAVRKRSILNEIILTSNYWMNNISCLIEIISRLVKNVITENEEKENVKSPRRCKMMQRRLVNSIPVNDTRQKPSTPRSKTVRTNLSKKDSTIETQMSSVSNSVNPLKQSKTFVKYSSRSPEKDKHQDNVQTNVVDKKAPDSSRCSERSKPSKKVILNMNINQCKQSISRQKHRTTSNPLPAWRPGGAIKVPSSSSATVLNQKLRSTIHTRERAYFEHAKTSANKRGSSMDHIVPKKNLTFVEKIPEDSGKRVVKVHYTIEEKQGHAISETKKNPSTEACSTKDIVPIPDTDNFKLLAKRSNTSLKTSPRLKLKLKTLKLPTKNRSESLHRNPDHAHSKNNASAYSCDVTEQISTESNDFCDLEEIIKGSPDNEDRGSKNSLLCYELHPENSACFKRPDESTLIEEEMKINEEEPTRDIDSKRYKNSRLKRNERFQEEHKLIEKLVQQSYFPDVESVGVSVNLDNFKPKSLSSFSCVTSASCLANCHSCSDGLHKSDTPKRCETSLNTISPSIVLQPQQKEGKHEENCSSKSYSIDSYEKEGKCHAKMSNTLDDQASIKIDSTNVNCHAASLTMLKEFLFDQGIDIDLVNRAERYLKDKRKTRKSLKRKSISFADVPSTLEHNEKLESRIKRESSLEEKLGTSVELSEEDNESDTHDSNRVVLPKKKDSTTSTLKASNNASSQTVCGLKVSKSLQTIPENDSLILNSQTVEIQTEVTDLKHVGIECQKKESKSEGVNVSSMTESLPVSDSSTETANIPRISKSVSIDHTNNLNKHRTTKSSKNLRKNTNPESKLKNLPSKSIQQSKSMDIKSANKNFEDYKNSSKQYTTLFRQLLNQMYKKCSDSSINIKKSDTENALPFVESNASLSSDYTTSFSKSSESYRSDENVTEDEVHTAAKVISSEILAALQVAAIRARNVYTAIDIYKQKLRNKASNNKRAKCKRKAKKASRTFTEETNGTSEVNGAVKVIMRKKKSNRSDIIEVSKILRQEQAKSALSDTSFDFYSESDEETFKSAETSSGITVSSEINFGIIRTQIPKKSTSSVVSRDVNSLMKFLVDETENVTFAGIECVRTMSYSDVRSKSDGNKEINDNKGAGRFSLFSRENLLPLVYGIVCSVVFLCLQFTIRCEVVL